MAIIHIDDKTYEVEDGRMVIEVLDKLGIFLPRFCYHKKLSLAANCRMCLVTLANSPKQVPACTTPITNGIKIYTKSSETRRSQEAIMEFLLINHPLDCPICDQGGECELQDVSLGFGYSNSEYKESKRSVEDDDLGSLISTEMTRCIHCTRCVRFGDEIAGLRELGATGRGESMQIGTYVKHSIVSEVSGNIIDLCPVGALTSKPFRFKARPWELTQYEGIAPHDCLGSNIYSHLRRDELMRVVPKENEAINETWLSDRDRFSYLGLNSQARAGQPKIKRNGQWETVDWETALKYTAEGISRVIKQYGPEQFASFASPSSSLEEFYLLQKLMRELGIHNIDHRIRQVDFRDQDKQATLPTSSIIYAEIENQHNVLLLGCNIHKEIPLAGVRLRKAFRNGAKLYAINSVDYDYRFGVLEKIIISPQELVIQVAKLVLAMTPEPFSLPIEVQRLLIGLELDEKTLAIATALQQPNSLIVMGAICENHPDAALLRTLVYFIEQLGVGILRLTTGANTAGAWLAGAVPHRGVGGKTVASAGLDVQAALDKKLKGYLLLGLEPGYDFANPSRTRQSMLGAEFVVLLSAFYNESMQDYANVILPIAPYVETSGTYINIDRTWQSVKGHKPPYAEARPAWKVLRVLGNLLGCNNFEYSSSVEVLEEIKSIIKTLPEKEYEPFYVEALPSWTFPLVRLGEWPLYRSDMIVRHAIALQQCAAAEFPCIRANPITVEKLQLGEYATVSQGDIEITLPLKADERIACDVIWVANAMPETIDLGHSFNEITIKR